MSATYTPALLEQLEALMTQPQRVLLSPGTTSLLGVRQFYSLVPGNYILVRLARCDSLGLPSFSVERSCMHMWSCRVLLPSSRGFDLDVIMSPDCLLHGIF